MKLVLILVKYSFKITDILEKAFKYVTKKLVFFFYPIRYWFILFETEFILDIGRQQLSLLYIFN